MLDLVAAFLLYTNTTHTCMKNTFHVFPYFPSAVGNEVFTTVGITQFIVDVYFFLPQCGIDFILALYTWKFTNIFI